MTKSPKQLLEIANDFARTYMGQFDASHDYQHIVRVRKLAEVIKMQERALHPDISYDSDIVALASLLHDVGDRKYLPSGYDAGSMVENFLLEHDAAPTLARTVQAIVTRVSYSAEVKDPGGLQTALSKYPELAIVQDADRLDAIGAVGIGRAFTFSAAKGDKNAMAAAVAHIPEKLLKLEGLMKTDTGRSMAKVRTERLRMFMAWWREETSGFPLEC
ncbi:MAG: hypothetical protein M1833_004130 [Piccolia ochrophora]|nr:MAG: hypothetical protein M1833_004130 [Piccolia ochrophora]